MRTKNLNKWIVLLVFCIIYCLISLVNHYNFRTKALDLGVYTNALYDYVHFNLADTSSFKTNSEILLTDHFDLYLILFSPLVLIFKTYTLLIIQIFSVLLGGLGVYKYFNLIQKNKNISLIAMIYFLTFFGVFSAISYDYHSNVVAACFVPYFFYFNQKNNYKKLFVVFLFIIIAKENMSLWLFFINLGFIIQYRNNKEKVKIFSLLAIVSLAYFLVVTQFIMPTLSNQKEFTQFRYSVFGDSYSDAVKYFITSPISAIKTLFTNHTNHPFGDYVKIETLIFLLISGLLFLLKKPSYLIMLIPIFLQKFYHDQIEMWSFFGQYSIEFAPIFTIGIFTVIISLKKEKIKVLLSVSVLILSIAVTIRTMDKTIFFTNKSAIRLYQKEHYIRKDINVKEIYLILNSIPLKASVSTQSDFFPHLSLRDDIYRFPIVNDAEYIVTSSQGEYFPFHSKEDYDKEITKYIDSNEWYLYLINNEIKILKKKKAP